MTREEKLVEALIEARTQFQLYGDLHLAKDPPQREKAAVNHAMVSAINKALMSADDDQADAPAAPGRTLSEAMDDAAKLFDVDAIMPEVHESALASGREFQQAYADALPVIHAAERLNIEWRTPGRQVDSDDFLHAVNEVSVAVSEYRRSRAVPRGATKPWPKESIQIGDTQVT